MSYLDSAEGNAVAIALSKMEAPEVPPGNNDHLLPFFSK